MELFHKYRSKSNRFTRIKSHSALCSMKKPFYQMNRAVDQVLTVSEFGEHLLFTCQLEFSPLPITANFSRYAFGIPPSTRLLEKNDSDIESLAVVKERGPLAEQLYPASIYQFDDLLIVILFGNLVSCRWQYPISKLKLNLKGWVVSQ